MQPIMSVVIPSYNSGEKALSCLEALGRQETDIPFEIIVVDSSDDGSGDLLEGRRDIKLIRSETRLYPGTGRNVGASHAGGKVICFTDTDCIPATDWLQGIWNWRPDENNIAVGGPILNGTPESMVGTAEYFSEFSSLLPSGNSRPVSFLPTANLALGRDRFISIGGFEDLEKGSDVAFGRRCRQEGVVIFFDPSIAVTHLNRTSLATFLSNQKAIGEGGGKNRARHRMSGSLMARFPPLWPMVPPARFLRIVHRGVLNARGKRELLMKSLPLIALGAIYYGSGFARGALEGFQEKE